MKNFICSLLVLCSYTLFSQVTTFSYEATSHHVEGNVLDENIYNPIHIDNLTDSTLHLNWEITNSNIPSTWDISNCDPDGCLPPGPSSSSFTLEVGTLFSNYINTHFYPNGTTGYGTVEKRVWSDYTSDEITFTFTAEVTEVPLNSNNASITNYWVVSKQNGNTNINFLFTETTSSITYSIFDVTGKKIKSNTIKNNDNITLEKELNSGIYFINIGNKDFQKTYKVLH